MSWQQKIMSALLVWLYHSISKKKYTGIIILDYALGFAAKFVFQLSAHVENNLKWMFLQCLYIDQ